MSTAEPRPFTAATNKLAFAQAFSAQPRRHRTPLRSKRTFGILRGRRRATQSA